MTKAEKKLVEKVQESLSIATARLERIKSCESEMLAAIAENEVREENKHSLQLLNLLVEERHD